MEELKPCPFCGGEAIVEQLSSSRHYWYRFVPHCADHRCVAFYIGYCDDEIYETKTKAIEVSVSLRLIETWNG